MLIRRKIKAVVSIIQGVTQEPETTAEVSVHEFAQVCKNVDLEIESRFAGMFAQKRTWEKAADYIAALSDPLIPVKSAWDAAEYSGYETPGPFQSLIGENKWSSPDVWECTAITAGKLVEKDAANDPLGVGILFDETADLKRGKMTCGVGYQYAGCAGGVVNCATWVMASLTGSTLKTWAAADLFLPRKDWFTGGDGKGTARRKASGIPRDVKFASKPEIALKQLRRIRELGIRISYGGGDEVYGRYGRLREDHEENGEAYAYFVPRNHIVRTLGRERRRVDELLELQHAVFGARSAGLGVKGPRYYEWAMVGIMPENHYLLLRRPILGDDENQEESGGENPVPGSPEDRRAGRVAVQGKTAGNVLDDRVRNEGITFCLCYIPPGSPIRPTLPNLILMTGKRWGAEETNATAKGPVGWDENQFRKWESMNHHTALAGIAMLRANMILQRLDAIRNGEESRPDTAAIREGIRDHDNRPRVNIEYSPADLQIPVGDSGVPVSAAQKIPGEIGFIRLSRNEVMRLAAIALSDMTEEMKAFHLRWSKWRRKHQAISRWYHKIARMKAEQESRGEPVSAGVVTQRDRQSGRLASLEPKAALTFCLKRLL